MCALPVKCRKVTTLAFNFSGYKILNDIKGTSTLESFYLETSFSINSGEYLSTNNNGYYDEGECPMIKMEVLSKDKGDFSFIGETEEKYEKENPITFNKRILFSNDSYSNKVLIFEIYVNNNKYKHFIIELYELLNSTKNHNTVEKVNSEGEILKVSILREKPDFPYKTLKLSTDFNETPDTEIYYVLSRAENNNLDKWIKIYKSEEQIGKLIDFNPAILPFNTIDLTDQEQVYLIEFQEFHANLKCHAMFSLSDLETLKGSINLIKGPVDKNLEITSSLKLKMEKSETPSKVHLNELVKLNKKVIGNAKAQIQKQNLTSFLSLLFKKLQFRVTFAVDFTLSNEVPTEKTSLHYISSNLNAYEVVIDTILSNLEKQGLIEKINMFGFGGVPSPKTSKAVEFLFPLNGKKNDPSVKNREEALKMYKESIRKVKLSAPALLQQSVSFVNNVETEKGDGLFYNLLIVLINGDITDMNEVIELVVESSKKPISILIIGLGNKGFERMDELSKEYYK